MAVEIHGMDELIGSVDALIKKYPDRTGDFLRKQAMETRKGIANEAKSPHFHLIEHGHEQVTPGGRHVGYVQGYKILDAEAKRREVQMPRAFEEMAEEVLKEEGFL